MAEGERKWRLEFERDHQQVMFRWAADDRWRGGAGSSLDVAATTPDSPQTTGSKKLRGDRVASLLLVLAEQHVTGTSPRDLCERLRGMPGWAPNIEARSVNPAIQEWLDADRAMDDGREHAVGPFVYRLDERRRSMLWLQEGVHATLPPELLAWLNTGASLRDAYRHWIADERPRSAPRGATTGAANLLEAHVGPTLLHWAYVHPPQGEPVSRDALEHVAGTLAIHGLDPDAQRKRYEDFARRLEAFETGTPLGAHEHGAVKRMFFDLEHGGFCMMRFARGGYVCAVVLEESRDGLRSLLQQTQEIYEALRPSYAPGDRDVILRIV